MSFGMAFTLTWTVSMTVFISLGLWAESRTKKKREMMEKAFYFGAACERARADRLRRNREQTIKTMNEEL